MTRDVGCTQSMRHVTCVKGHVWETYTRPYKCLQTVRRRFLVNVFQSEIETDRLGTRLKLSMKKNGQSRAGHYWPPSPSYAAVTSCDPKAKATPASPLEPPHLNPISPYPTVTSVSQWKILKRKSKESYNS